MTKGKPTYRIAVVNDKGGVGKTLLSMMLAQYLHRQGKRVLLHDTDLSGSSLAWRDNAEAVGRPLPFPVCDNNALTDALMTDHFDFIVVDTPTDAKAKQNIVSLAKVSDCMLIPIQPGALELDRMELTLDVIRGTAAQMKPDMQLGFVINRREDTIIAEETAAYLKERNYTQVGTIPRSVIYQEAFGTMLQPRYLRPISDILKKLKIKL